MAYVTLSIFLLFIIISAQPSSALTFTTKFRHWYPQYASVWEEILQSNCSDQYTQYLTGVKDLSKIDWIGGGGIYSVLTEPVVQCLLSNLSEYNKAAMTSAQVLLGIIPTVLALLSARYEELAMLVIVSRRPILATLLAIGSPSVFLSRAFNYYSPKDVLERKKDRLPQCHLTGAAKWAIAIVEYLVAIAAVANVAHVCYELGIQSITNVWADTVLMPMIWVILVLFIHLFGVISMRLRVRRDMTYARRNGERLVNKGPMRWFQIALRLFEELLRTEMTPSVAQPDLRVTFFPESQAYVGLSWGLSVVIICYTIFGTLLMSTFLFLGTLDALLVAGRYIASVLVCRTILMYEISGIREVYILSNQRLER